jgi:hypothetical protein
VGERAAAVIADQLPARAALADPERGVGAEPGRLLSGPGVSCLNFDKNRCDMSESQSKWNRIKDGNAPLTASIIARAAEAPRLATSRRVLLVNTSTLTLPPSIRE